MNINQYFKLQRSEIFNRKAHEVFAKRLENNGLQIYDAGETLFSKTNLRNRKAKTRKPYYLIKTGGIDTTGIYHPCLA